MMGKVAKAVVNRHCSNPVFSFLLGLLVFFIGTAGTVLRYVAGDKTKQFGSMLQEAQVYISKNFNISFDNQAKWLNKISSGNEKRYR